MDRSMAPLPATPHRWLAALASCVLAGCAAVGPDYTRPEIGVPPLWQRTGDSRVAATEKEDLSAWWERLQDPLLSGLIGESLAGSPDLKSAQARLRQARALRAAVAIDARAANEVPSTKGSLGG